MKCYKKLFYFKVFYLLDLYQLILLKKFKNKKILVLDIDNTLTINKLGEKIDHKNPIPRMKLMNYLECELYPKYDNILFMSARDFCEYGATKKWLKKNDIYNRSSDLFLVKSAQSKIKYIRRLKKITKDITYIDDLSYNHENGEIKLYTDVINEIERIGIDYRGLKYIESI